MLGATPAVTNGRGSGLRKDPTASQLDHVAAVRAATNIVKRIRYIWTPANIAGEAATRTQKRLRPSRWWTQSASNSGR